MDGLVNDPKLPDDIQRLDLDTNCIVFFFDFFELQIENKMKPLQF